VFFFRFFPCLCFKQLDMEFPKWPWKWDGGIMA
jgi:hypothetical protein